MTSPAPPALVGIPDVPLIDTGSWQASTGTFNPTPDDLAAAVAALDCPSVRRPVLKLGHTGVMHEGEPLIGYVAAMRLEQQGHRLVGDFAGMPAWLAAEASPGAGSVVSSAYPDRSVEGRYGFHCQAGHTHPFVVTAVALLGVEQPAIGTLTSLQDLYGVAASGPAPQGGVVSIHSPTKESRVTSPAGTVAASHSVEDVRRVYYATAGSDWMWWIRQVHADPNQLIVENDSDGCLYRVPFDAAGDEVVFGDPVKVVVEYRDVAAGRGPSLAQLTGGRLIAAAYADRASSRAGGPDRPVAAAAGTTPAQEERSMDPAKLREALGLPADATDQQVQSALDAAGLVAPAPGTATPAAEPATDTVPTPAATPVEPATDTVPTPVVTAPVVTDVAASGVVTVDAAALAQLQRDAAQGVAARQQQENERRSQLVAAAVADGRIPPARAQHWSGLLAADPGSETVLAGLAPDTVPVTEKGHSGTGDDSATVAAQIRETPVYKNWSLT